MSLTLQLPPVPPPESVMIPGMAAPRPGAETVPPPAGAIVFATDTSGPGPFALQQPFQWSYDTETSGTPGQARASYAGDVSVNGALTASNLPATVTGSGAMVLQNSPVIGSPTIASPIITGTVTGSPTINTPTISGGTLNLATFAGGTISGTIAGGATYTAPTLTGPTISGTVAGGASYTAPTLTGPTISGNISGAPNLSGTTTNNNAPAGYVGEVLSASVAGPGSAITTNTFTAITSISLTAGDWDVWGFLNLAPAAGTTLNGLNFGTSTSSSGFATLPQISSYAAAPAGWGYALPTATARLSIAVTTTVYLIAYVGFAGGTCTAYGSITARRAR